MNENNNLNNNQFNNAPVQNNGMYRQPQPLSNQKYQPLFPEVEEKKSNAGKIIVIVIVALILAAAGYFIYTKLSSAVCIDDFKIEMSMGYDDQFAVASGDTQYIFDSNFDVDFISSALELEEIKLKICYKNKNKNTLFHLGETTETRMVDSFELYDKTNNKKLNADNMSDLLKELGYHSFGKHTEEVTIVEIDDDPTYEFDSGKSYISYNIEIEFDSGKKIVAKYPITDGKTNKIKQLTNGKKYTIDFEVKEGDFSPIVYTITNFK